MPNQNENILRQNVLGNQTSGPAQERLAGREMRRDKVAAMNKERIGSQVGGNQMGAMPQAGGKEEEGQTEGEANEDSERDTPNRFGDIRDYRQEMARSRQEAKNKEDEKKAKPKKDSPALPLRLGTDRMLRWAWATLVPSWGLSIIYINTHVLLRFIFPDAFCKLGEEWVPKIVTPSGESTAKNVAGTAFGIVEIAGLLALDLLFLFIILSMLAFISMIVSWMGKGVLDKIWGAVKAIYDLGWGGIKALSSLF